MGTKRQLAPAVAELATSSRPGAFLDLFAGMCSVGSAVAPHRQVWTNDCQVFAWSVADAYFCSSNAPLAPDDATTLVYPLYKSHVEKLRGRVDISLAKEALAESTESCDLFCQIKEQSDQELKGTSPDKSHDLFLQNYAGTYFSISQTIEVDSIRYAIDSLRDENRLTHEEHRWLLLSLCRAISKVSTTTGHFAQPLRPKPATIRRINNQRRRSVWTEWSLALPHLFPLGSSTWRKQNQAARRDSLEHLDELATQRHGPSVIYADPPYTDDQYSRFYHLYETLVLYDYPESFGVGQYRPDRHVSTFSLASRVEGALQALIAKSSQLGSDLILSYPTNGLLPGSRERIPLMLRGEYRTVRAIEVPYTHSTMGASKGSVSAAVTEVIYHARH